ncbi:hypothetical protein MJI95_37245, partial [Salmonella enterica subsp. enterica serovar Kentucky]|nr:hypothetical protein [Salmonella enterica subsp. enterica serovar Kentucky]
KVATTDEEPILGQTYLPRKFKTTVVIPPQNDIDLHANDMNFVAQSLSAKRLMKVKFIFVGEECHEIFIDVVYDFYIFKFASVLL